MWNEADTHDDYDVDENEIKVESIFEGTAEEETNYYKTGFIK